ncbi:hypothetical protein AB0O34_18360 [Sphaerisporangium sp. NPDC088356]|uniref:hypothetical protein n=1 Tax=Sphaerisporangium sp. NPDC088356 TaxID=3154871 RepID=UPI003419F9EA
MKVSTERRRHTDHDHVHQAGCGHVAIPHGDHVDYVHDRCIHRVEGMEAYECEPAGHVVHEGHTHQHGSGCGHVSVPHGDHVDYIHDGHRHSVHDGHCDEH